MRKLFEIIAWTVAFVVLLCIIAAAFPVGNIKVSPGTWEAALVNFEGRQDKYDGFAPVIIGPSYARMVGENSSFSNLGLGSARQPDISIIANMYCRNSKRIIYLTTIRETLNTKAAPRFAIQYPLFRHLAILRGSFRHSILRIQRKRHNIPDDPFRNVGQFDNGESIDTSFYDRFYARHPNTIFILHPMAPLPDTERGRKLAGLVREYCQWFKDSGLPYIDLTNQFPLEQFGSVLHLKKTACIEMRDLIIYVCNANSAATAAWSVSLASPPAPQVCAVAF